MYENHAVPRRYFKLTQIINAALIIKMTIDTGFISVVISNELRVRIKIVSSAIQLLINL